jgi:hypothetical protein
LLIRCSPPVRISRSGSGANDSPRIRRCRDEFADGLHDVPPAAVAGADGQVQPRVLLRGVFRLADQRPQRRVERRQVADDAQPDALFLQLGDFALQRGDEQPHQRADFVLGPLPVLRAEGEQA